MTSFVLCIMNNIIAVENHQESAPFVSSAFQLLQDGDLFITMWTSLPSDESLGLAALLDFKYKAPQIVAFENVPLSAPSYPFLYRACHEYQVSLMP